MEGQLLWRSDRVGGYKLERVMAGVKRFKALGLKPFTH